MMAFDPTTLPRTKEEIERSYEAYLAPFATSRPVENSRKYFELERAHENRGSFQRDRDRIIHSKAFRRLMYKTQVFVNHEGDHFRTRLTHTLEVAQFARGICKSLALNEDLAEAIAYGHDLGHTPFGHAVERYLDKELKTREMGEFLHNEQSVRVVDFIEHRSDDYRGLNLTAEVREGILKHNGDSSKIYQDLSPDKPCSSLEGQVVKLVDTVAYICHDLQDGIQSGLVEAAMNKNKDFKADIDAIQGIIKTLPIKAEVDFSRFSKTYFIDELIHFFIMSITNGSITKIKEEKILSLADVKTFAKNGKEIICMQKEDAAQFKALRKLIYKSVYGIHTIQTMDSKAEMVAHKLFDTFTNNPKLLPPKEFEKYMYVTVDSTYTGFKNNEIHVICDYIAGMTDRFALEEYERITNPLIKI